MDGKLTFDKSNRDFDHFIYAIKLVGETGRLSRRDFSIRFAKKINGEATLEDGKENRAWYNKSNFCRYYGFLDLDSTGDESYLTITPRGKRFLKLLEPLPNGDGISKSWIPTCRRLKLLELFIEAFNFDTFGYNNTGADESRSHVSPPTAMFRLIHDIPGITNQEITFVLFKMHKKDFLTIEDAIEQVKRNQAIPGFSYDDIIKDLNIVKQTSDFKLGGLFVHPGINFLSQITEKGKGSSFVFSNDVPLDIRESFRQYDGFSKPVRLLIQVRSDVIFKQWARNVVAGSTADDSKIFWADFNKISFIDFKKNVFIDALVSAFVEPKKTTYLFMFAKTKSLLLSEMGYLESLLDFLGSVNDPCFGCSTTEVYDEEMVDVIVKRCKNTSTFTPVKIPYWNEMVHSKKVKLPKNLHVVGGYQHEQ